MMNHKSLSFSLFLPLSLSLSLSLSYCLSGLCRKSKTVKTNNFCAIEWAICPFISPNCATKWQKAERNYVAGKQVVKLEIHKVRTAISN